MLRTVFASHVSGTVSKDCDVINVIHSPWKTRAVIFGLAKRQRLDGVGGRAIAMTHLVGIMGSSKVGGGVWVPERGILLGMGLVEFSFSLPLPCSVFVLCQQCVKALPPPWHRPPLA